MDANYRTENSTTTVAGDLRIEYLLRQFNFEAFELFLRAYENSYETVEEGVNLYATYIKECYELDFFKEDFS